MAVLLACGALIDDEDLPVVAGITFRVRGHGHVEFKRGGRTQLLHRLILGVEAGQMVDHINGNPLDNRRCNLRLCTHAQNMQNRRMHKNNASGFKGVWLDPRRGTYRATIRAFNHTFNLGSFATAEAASRAYEAKAAEVHGEFYRPSTYPIPA